MEKQCMLGCVVLAAGNATRFGSNKLAAQLQGRSLILRTLESIPAELFQSVVVVTQYPEIMRLAKEFHFAAIHNSEPELGLSHTIQLGLTGLRNCDGILFLVSDQPFLQRDSIAELIRLWKEHPDHIAALSHDGVRGNPCLFPSRFFPALMELRGDHGGRSVIRQNEDALILLEVSGQELTDIDTQDAIKAFQ